MNKAQKTLAILALTAWPALAATERSLTPDDFAFGTALEVDGASSVYVADVPLDLYKSVTRADRGDVRVFNADGATVPFTLADGGQTEEELSSVTNVVLFPLREDANQSPDALTVMIRRGSPDSGDGSEVNVNESGAKPDKKIVAYLASTDGVSGPIRVFSFYWEGISDSFVKTVSVEASDDLKSWRTLTDDGVISRLTMNNLGLDKNRIEIPATKASFFRFKVRDAGDLVLTSATAEYVTGVKTAERVWLTVPGVASKDRPRTFSFDVGARLPVDRVEVVLPEGNHAISADLYASDKSDAPVETDRDYQYSGVLYRLKQSGHELTTGPINPSMNSSRSSKPHWFLAIREESSDLGDATPSLKLGWVPEKIVFVAQGKGPYTLAYGSGLARKPRSEVEALLQDNSGIERGAAKVGARKILGGAAKLLPPPPAPPTAGQVWGKRAAFAGMALATLLLGWIAYRLARQMPENPEKNDGDNFAPTRKILLEAKTVSVLTGAGVSAESGIPTFRDRDGVWAQFDPQKVATREAFLKDPKYVWEWYILRMRAMRKAEPNPAHHALARLEKATPKFTLITQNIDDLHSAAGSKNVIELHGNLWRAKCIGCRRKSAIDAIPERVPPICPACGQMLRPDVVWFGEMLDPKDTAAAEAACAADVFLVIGTSGEVWPAAGYAQEASQRGAYVIEVNLAPTAISGVANTSLFGKAASILPKLVP